MTYLQLSVMYEIHEQILFIKFSDYCHLYKSNLQYVSSTLHVDMSYLCLPVHVIDALEITSQYTMPEIIHMISVSICSSEISRRGKK